MVSSRRNEAIRTAILDRVRYYGRQLQIVNDEQEVQDQMLAPMAFNLKKLKEAQTEPQHDIEEILGVESQFLTNYLPRKINPQKNGELFAHTLRRS